MSVYNDYAKLDSHTESEPQDFVFTPDPERYETFEEFDYNFELLWRECGSMVGPESRNARQFLIDGMGMDPTDKNREKREFIYNQLKILKNDAKEKGKLEMRGDKMRVPVTLLNFHMKKIRTKENPSDYIKFNEQEKEKDF